MRNIAMIAFCAALVACGVCIGYDFAHQQIEAGLKATGYDCNVSQHSFLNKG